MNTENTINSIAVKIRPNKFMQNIKKYFWFYVLLLPGIAVLFVFNYMPMYGVLIAFQNFDIVSGISGSEWVGLLNFKKMFMSAGFYEVFKNSILISIYRLLWGFPMPIILAILLNELRGKNNKKIAQTAIYLPHFISWVVIAGMIQTFLSSNGGLINTITASFGIAPTAFLQKPEYFRTIIVVSDIWKETGWGTIMFLAALVGINTELYEAARIDGAGRFKMIYYITLPSILNTIIIVFVLRMGSVLRNGFEQIFLLQNPLVLDVADVFETYTYRLGLIEGRYDIATAIGLFQSVIGFIFILSANKIAKKFSDGGALW